MKRLAALVVFLALFGAVSSAPVASAPPVRACNDGLDNDGDGLIDYPADPGCDGRNDRDEFDAPPPPPPGDTTAPTVLITQPPKPPPGGFTPIDGVVSLAANASDNVGVASVTFYWGSELIAVDTQAPYTASWDSAGWADGFQNAFDAVARDAAGNTATDRTYVEIDRGSPPPPPPPPNYPASYFTGPLGAGNILPPDANDAFLLASVVAPQSEGTTWAAHQAQILQRESQMGRKYDGLMATDWVSEWGENHLEWIHSGGRIPIVFGWNTGFTNAQVLAGAANSVIDQYADHWKAKPFKIMVRMHHECEAAHTVYTCNGQPATYRDAWRYIVDRFEARGATNVGFWYSPGESHQVLGQEAYPGDAWVDWTGSDGYNWVLHGEDLYCTPYEPGWCSFSDVFHYPLGFANLTNRHDYFGPTKPFVIGETGTIYDPAVPSAKGQWYRDLATYASANMPHLAGVAFFDVNAAEHGEAPRNNWLVDHPVSDPSALAGFVAMANDPYFTR